MERFVRVLTVFFWVAATLFVALLFTAGLSYDLVVGLLGSERLETVNAVLVVTVAVCSSLIGWHEFRANPAEETTYGQEGGLLRYHVLDCPILVLLLRPSGVLRPLSFATVLCYSPTLVE